MDYAELVRVINEIYITSTRFENSPFYFYLEKDIRTVLAKELNSNADEIELDLGRIVSSQLDWNNTGNIYIAFEEPMQEWIQKRYIEPPIFTPLLVALTGAAERMRRTHNDNNEFISSTNYYKRLFEVFETQDEHRQNAIRNSAQHTEKFWRIFNTWLIDNNEEFGTPTAKRGNSNNKFVFYSISQAIIRSEDRVKFHELFHKLHISPQESFNNSQMELYIDEWLTGNNNHPRLKSIWNNQKLRSSMCDAAIQELNVWDGSYTDAGSTSKSKSLLWHLAITTFLVRGFQINLIMNSDSIDIVESIEVSDDTPEVMREIILNNNLKLHLTPKDSDTVCVGPKTTVKELLPYILGHELILEGSSTKDQFKRRQRHIIPFEKSTLNQYTEVRKVRVGQKYIVLCYESYFDDVKKYLDSINSSYKDIERENGIPKGWVVFLDVTFKSFDTRNEEDFKDLNPVVSGSSIDISQGVKLSKNIWHSHSPPKVKAFHHTQDNSLYVSIEEQLANGETDEIVEDRYDHFVENILEALEVGERNDKNFTISLINRDDNDSDLITSKEISFRNAMKPRASALNPDKELAFNFSEDNSKYIGYSAAPLSGHTDASVVLRGMCLNTNAKKESKYNLGVLKNYPKPIKNTNPEVDEDIKINFENPPSPIPVCIDRGYCHFDVVDLNKTGTKRQSICRDCGKIQ